MPYAITDDGNKLYYEEVGDGSPIIFIHEFADDLRSWKPQIEYLIMSYGFILFVLFATAFLRKIKN